MEIDENGKKTYPYIPQDPISRSQMTIIEACIAAGVPVGLISSPGVGKTKTIEAIGETMGRNVVDLSMPDLPSQDVSGIPAIQRRTVNKGGDNETEVAYAKYTMPDWQIAILEDPNSVLFLDEFSTTGSDTQHAFLQIVQDRKFPGSDLHFSKNVAIIIAMNPDAQSGGTSLDPPIANRFAWYPFTLSTQAFVEGFRTAWRVDKPMPMPKIEMDPERIAKREKKLRNMIIEFIYHAASEQLVVMPDPTADVSNVNNGSLSADDDRMTNPQKRSGNEDTLDDLNMLAYQTPRSLENMVNILKHIPKDDTATFNMAVNGAIGAVQGQMFNRYYAQHNDDFDIDEVMDDPYGQDYGKANIVNNTTALFNGLINAAENDNKFLKAIEVYFAIAKSGHHELLSGDRIHKIWVKKYMHDENGAELSKEKLAELTDRYLEYFGDVLRKTTENHSTKRNRSKKTA